jgi:hypothetical protein
VTTKKTIKQAAWWCNVWRQPYNFQLLSFLVLRVVALVELVGAKAKYLHVVWVFKSMLFRISACIDIAKE